MRAKLALAAVVAGAAATLAPTPASAVCFPWFYDLTGYCNPCNLVGAGVNAVDRLAGGGVVAPGDCAA